MRNEIVSSQGFLTTNTFEEAVRCSELIANSSLCPANYAKRPADVLVAMQMGQELGLKPMQALQNIAVIQGRPSLWGDAMLAVCRQAHDFEYVDETLDEANMVATCKAKRRDEPEVVRTFSMKDAQVAGLGGKGGPWKTYPKRMLQMRARGFALRDTFPDVLRGIIIREEAMDMPRADFSESSAFTIEASAVSPTTISEEKIQILFDKAAQADKPMDKILAHCKVESPDLITENQWVEVCRSLDKTIKRKTKTQALEINQVFDNAESAQSAELPKEA
jgi:hypothetical protein